MDKCVLEAKYQQLCGCLNGVSLLFKWAEIVTYIRRGLHMHMLALFVKEANSSTLRGDINQLERIERLPLRQVPYEEI